MTYADFIQKYIFDRVKMAHSYYSSNTNNNSLTKGYSKIGSKLETAHLQEITTIYAAGGLASNATDLVKWHTVLFNEKLFGQKITDRVRLPYKLSSGEVSDYGYGWFISQIEGTNIIEHSGSTDGYQTDIVYIPDKDVRIITLFNCYESDKDWMILTNDIARLVLDKPINGSIQLSKDHLQDYVGVYQHTEEWQMIFSLKGNDLYVRCPEAGIPDIKLYALKENYFYVKETPIKFELQKQPDGSMLLTTYNNSGKDADWKRIDR